MSNALSIVPDAAATAPSGQEQVADTTGSHACNSVDTRPASLLQPVSNVRRYLDSRAPAVHFCLEDRLFVTLPLAIREELRKLLGTGAGTSKIGGAFGHIQHLVKTGYSVQQAAAEARNLYKVQGSVVRLRARYDAWSKSQDWVSLVNCVKAGADWQERDGGLPHEFLVFCAARFGKYRREDSKRQALLEIKHQWVTGRNSAGEIEPIPGYPASTVAERKLGARTYPPGWSYSNILRQIKDQNLFPKSVRALMHQGTAAARSYIPQTRFDRNSESGPMRFLECVEFDDVKTDFIIIDPESGQACDLWLLVARDRATAILLGFGLRPARTRDDGTQEHLRLRDMKQLCGWILERYGLPPYEMTWKIEHGTATLSPGTRAALRELLPDRIDISYSSMIGGLSPDGYAQRGLGNSKGKASLESHNRLMHTMLADQPGQTGPLYNVRPMDLQARVKEAVATWELTRHLPENIRGQVGYSLLTINQAREQLFRVFRLQNERTDHDLQGFADVAEWYNDTSGLWMPQSTWPGPADGMPPVRRRKESPLERCARLVAPYRDHWSQVSPDIIRAFYEHTAREVWVKDNGLIEFRTDDRLIEFMPPDNAELHQVPGTGLLAYFNPDDPAYLHLTDGRGRIIGTWLRRARASDADAVRQAIHYSQSALKAAKTVADTYAADERERLAAMRERNAELLQANTFVAVDGAIAEAAIPAVTSPVAAGLSQSRASVKRAEKQRVQTADDARASLLNAML